MITNRLQKVLSQAGLGSRREMERWIQEGLVQINGRLAKIGEVANAEDKITVKGKLIDNPLKNLQNTRILLYHKPVGEISSRFDAHHEKTVFETLPYLKKGRWIQVGRLDINTSGLLIFTNDGELAHRLMHPKYALEREYAVRVRGQVTQAHLDALLKGVQLEDGLGQFKRIKFHGGEGTNAWYHVMLTEGRNREVRRLWQSQGLEVSRLIRIRYGKLLLPRSLARGKAQELSINEVTAFLKILP